ncbi:MAG: hybrid sensor histidine kinase/response regulator, partial [Ruminococcus sp.]|nr:hybrid sensor histidine kinase/response regulator [Ruminococcus sp.]
HDIRTPMNAIIGMTDIARSNIDNKEKVEMCLQKITRSSRHLLSLINDVLDMSKIESGKMTLSMVQISFRESIENIVSVIQPQVNSKHHKFDIYINNIISENVYCDSLRLNQVLINLLSNAVKYTPDEGIISLSLYQEESPKGTEYVRNHIIVKDNGIGMTQDFIKVIFDDFVREDKKRVSKEEGTGLGMAITKHIIDVMGGTIEVSSTPNEGSEFHVVLDLKKGDTDIHNMNLEGLKVLLADDDDDLCLSVMQSLKEIGAEAAYVTDGMQVIETIKNNPDKFDVILVDWRMPDMNGVEIAKKIREYTTSNIPVILISAYDLAEMEEKAKDAGINGFIPKPLFKSTLFFGIKRHIENDSELEINNEASAEFNGERILLVEDN